MYLQKPADVISLSPWFIYCADHQHIRGGDLLTAISTSIPSYSAYLPLCPEALIKAFGVFMFLNNQFYIILNIYSAFGIFPDDWISDLTTLFDESFIIVGDFNLNILFIRLPPSPHALNSMNWLD